MRRSASRKKEATLPNWDEVMIFGSRDFSILIQRRTIQ